MSLQIIAVKRRDGFQQASIKKVVPQRVLPSRALMQQKEPRSLQIRPLPPESWSTLYSLDYAKPSRLVSESLDKFFPLDPELKFPLY